MFLTALTYCIINVCLIYSPKYTFLLFYSDYLILCCLEVCRKATETPALHSSCQDQLNSIPMRRLHLQCEHRTKIHGVSGRNCATLDYFDFKPYPYAQTIFSLNMKFISYCCDFPAFTILSLTEYSFIFQYIVKIPRIIRS